MSCKVGPIELRSGEFGGLVIPLQLFITACPIPEQMLWCGKVHRPAGGTISIRERYCHEGVFTLSETILGGSKHIL